MRRKGGRPTTGAGAYTFDSDLRSGSKATLGSMLGGLRRMMLIGFAAVMLFLFRLFARPRVQTQSGQLLQYAGLDNEMVAARLPPSL